MSDLEAMEREISQWVQLGDLAVIAARRPHVRKNKVLGKLLWEAFLQMDKAAFWRLVEKECETKKRGITRADIRACMALLKP